MRCKIYVDEQFVCVLSAGTLGSVFDSEIGDGLLNCCGCCKVYSYNVMTGKGEILKDNKIIIHNDI